MKMFLQEYGISICICCVIVMLVAIASPISLSIEGAIEGVAKVSAGKSTENIKKTLPNEYQEVEYIQREGAPQTNHCYIKTGVNCVVGLEFETTIDSLYDDGLHYIVLGAYSGFQTKVNNHHYYVSKIPNGYFTAYNKQTIKSGANSTNRYNFHNNTYYNDGKISRNLEVYLFTLNGYYKNGLKLNIPEDDNGTTQDLVAQFNGKFYSCKARLNGELIREFVPCYRKSDGEVGLYDLVEGKFYQNSGTGTFSKGADV